MSAYAVAHLRRVTVGPEVVDYIERIDATLAPFGGRFLVHGGAVELLEGAWVGDLIVIAFPDLEHARGWYLSMPYQDILPLRTGNSEGDVILAPGVFDGHLATDILDGLVRSDSR